MIVRDNWLSTYDTLKAHSLTVGYGGVTNPYDGIEYPDITVDIPDECRKEVVEKLGDLLGDIEIKQMFMRLTTLNTSTPPHQAHPDNMMGTHTVILYMNNAGGTSLVKHVETGMTEDPPTEELWHVWKRDTNTPEAWRIYDIAEGRENRVAVFDSRLLHRAEPIGGYGTSAVDGRVVLTAFIDVKDSNND